MDIEFFLEAASQLSAFGRPAHLLLGLLALCCFGFAYVALTNQTPYCYTLREFSDGRVDYREFATSPEATHYENQQGFWKGREDSVREESGCASDKVYAWEAALSGTFAILGLTLPVIGVKPSGVPGAADVIAKTILGLLTIGSLLSLVSVGAIVGPLLIPFHWLAARRASAWTRGVWIFFAGVCSWILGTWVVYASFSEGSWASLLVPLMVSGFMTIMFVATTSREFQDWTLQRIKLKKIEGPA